MVYLYIFRVRCIEFNRRLKICMIMAKLWIDWQKRINLYWNNSIIIKIIKYHNKYKNYGGLKKI